MAKLNEDDARMIVELHERHGLTTRELAQKYRVSQSTIAKVIRADTWRHI